MFVIAGALLLGNAAQAQSVDEIVKKHCESMGGNAAWKSVTSLKYIGSVNAQGMDIPISRTIVAGKGMRQDIEVMGMKGYSILTTTAGWNYMPWGGQTKAEPITADDVKQGQSELDITDELFDYTAKGSKLEMVGKDDVEGTECLKLKLTEKSGQVAFLFVDPSNYYVIRQVQKVKANGQEQEVTVNMSNFQKLPEGIVVPMTIGTGQGDFKVNKVEVNTIKDDSIFKPEEPKKG